MVKQGDIVKVSFDPQSGHEQSGYRPVLVVSNNKFNSAAKLAIVCPITNTNNKFPLHVSLDERTKTTGVVLCENVKALDLNAREHLFVEKIPKDILERVIDIIFAELDIPDN